MVPSSPLRAVEHDQHHVQLLRGGRAAGPRVWLRMIAALVRAAPAARSASPRLTSASALALGQGALRGRAR